MNSMNGKKIAIIVCLLLIGGAIGFCLGKASHNIETNDTQNQYEESGSQDEELDQDTTQEHVDNASNGKQESSSEKDSEERNTTSQQEEKKDEMQKDKYELPEF